MLSFEQLEDRCLLALSINGYDPPLHDRFYLGSDKAFIGEAFDLSGIGRVAGSSGKWATMVSPYYFVSAAHHHPNTGDPIRFYHTNDPSGPSEDHIVQSAWQIRLYTNQSFKTDLWLGKLETPISDSVNYFKIFTQQGDFEGRQMYIVGQSNTSPADSSVRMGLNEVKWWAGSAVFYYDNNLQPGNTFLHGANPQGGDSGGPSFFSEMGELQIIGTHTTSIADTGVSGLIPPHGGDLDLDYDVDADDIDLLFERIGREDHDPRYDLTHDGLVNSEDMDSLIFNELNTSYGDSNLDGFVDTIDLGVFRQHAGTPGGWSNGNFNGDDFIDAEDLAIFRTNVGSNTQAVNMLSFEQLEDRTLLALTVSGYDPAIHDRFYIEDDKAFIAENLDLSGIGKIPGSDGRWATMISPYHFVSATHWHPVNGHTVRFYHTNDPGGSFEDHIVSSEGGAVLNHTNTGGSDLWLGKLRTPVSDAVAHYDVFVPDETSYVGRSVYIVGQSNTSPRERSVRVGINDIAFWGPTFASFSGDGDVIANVGDSGGPSFFVENGILQVIGTHTGPIGDVSVSHLIGGRCDQYSFVSCNNPRNDSDINNDGESNAEDIDLLFEQIGNGTHNPIYDLTHDGLVNEDDMNDLVVNKLATSYGDSDLNGVVDTTDLANFRSHAGTTGGWSVGNFNGDSFIDAADLAILRFNVGIMSSAINERPYDAVDRAAFITHVGSGGFGRDEGDFNNDGLVDAADWQIFFTNVGSSRNIDEPVLLIPRTNCYKSSTPIFIDNSVEKLFYRQPRQDLNLHVSINLSAL